VETLSSIYWRYVPQGQKGVDGRNFIKMCRIGGIVDDDIIKESAIERIFSEKMSVSKRRLDFTRLQDALHEIAALKGFSQEGLIQTIAACHNEVDEAETAQERQRREERRQQRRAARSSSRSNGSRSKKGDRNLDGVMPSDIQVASSASAANIVSVSDLTRQVFANVSQREVQRRSESKGPKEVIVANAACAAYFKGFGGLGEMDDPGRAIEMHSRSGSKSSVVSSSSQMQATCSSASISSDSGLVPIPPASPAPSRAAPRLLPSANPNMVMPRSLSPSRRRDVSPTPSSSSSVSSMCASTSRASKVDLDMEPAASSASFLSAVSTATATATSTAAQVSAKLSESSSSSSSSPAKSKAPTLLSSRLAALLPSSCPSFMQPLKKRSGSTGSSKDSCGSTPTTATPKYLPAAASVESSLHRMQSFPEDVQILAEGEEAEPEAEAKAEAAFPGLETPASEAPCPAHKLPSASPMIMVTPPVRPSSGGAVRSEASKKPSLEFRSSTLDATFEAFAQGQDELDCKAFVKLCKRCCLLDDKFTSQSARLLFSSNVPLGAKMDLVSFSVALGQVAAQRGLEEGLVRRMVSWYQPNEKQAEDVTSQTWSEESRSQPMAANSSLETESNSIGEPEELPSSSSQQQQQQQQQRRRLRRSGSMPCVGRLRPQSASKGCSKESSGSSPASASTPSPHSSSSPSTSCYYSSSSSSSSTSSSSSSSSSPASSMSVSPILHPDFVADVGDLAQASCRKRLELLEARRVSKGVDFKQEAPVARRCSSAGVPMAMMSSCKKPSSSS